MSDARDDYAQRRRPHTQSMAEPYLEFDLARELSQLNGEPAKNSGQNAKTLVKYDNCRVVLTALKTGARLPEHQTEGRISMQIVAGRIQVRAEGRTFNLFKGSLLALGRGVRHDVEALEDSACLLTVALPRRDESA